MRQSAWLKRLDCDATRPETAQSSRTNQINQLPATRGEMFDCGPDIHFSGKTKKVALVAFMRKRLTTLNAMPKPGCTGGRNSLSTFDGQDSC